MLGIFTPFLLKQYCVLAFDTVKGLLFMRLADVLAQVMPCVNRLHDSAQQVVILRFNCFCGADMNENSDHVQNVES